MTEDEKRMAIALNGCTFVPGIGTKRFARQMARAALLDESPELTPKQREYLRKAVIRFRRQIDSEIVRIAVRMTPA